MNRLSSVPSPLNISTIDISLFLSSISFKDDTEVLDPSKILKSISLSDMNRLIIGQLNINSLRNKFESRKIIIKGNLDINYNWI